MKKFYKIIFVLLLIVLSIVFSETALAQYWAPPEGAATLNSGSQPVNLPNPLGNNAADPNYMIGKVINGVLGVVGSLALLMFILGGLVWMTAAGNQDRVTKGKNILIWATVGLIVIFTAYALVRFVFTGLGVG